MTDPAVRVEGLCHRYPAPVKRGRRSHSGDAGATPKEQPGALDRVSFDVSRGEIFGILGPNGGGKTTLFRILSTLLRPTAGRVSVLGHCAVTRPQDVRRCLGVVFQMPSLDGKLTATENLLHAGHLYGLRGGDLEQRIARSLEQVGLSEKKTVCVELFSGGMRRRVELAKAMLHDPPLLLLDEPSTGLDVAGRSDLWRYLIALRQRNGTTVMLTTHLMDEADRCDRLAILNHGGLVAVDTPANLKARIGGDVITIQPVAGRSAGLAGAIAQRFPAEGAGLEGPRSVGGRVVLERHDGPAFVATLAAAFPGQIHSITVGQPTLEDVFMHLTGASFSPS